MADPIAVPQVPVRSDAVLPVAASGARARWRVLAICSLLLLAVGLVFGQTIRHEFVNYDDGEYVYENPPVAHGLTAQGIAWAFTHSHSANWHPLTWISLMLDCQFYGLNAGGYHLTNVLLHAATAVLLFLVLRAMTGRMWPSALAAALFAVHPLRVESVAWVTERKDVLSGLFFVLTLGAYVGYVRHRFSWVRYLAVMVVFALGLMAKPLLVTLPFVLLLLDYWPLRRMSDGPLLNRMSPHGNGGAFAGDASFSKTELGRFSFPWRLVLEKVPLLALVLISCVLTVWAQREALESIEHFPLWWRMGNAAVSYVVYLGQFFCPLGLAVLYPRLDLDLPLWKVFGAVLVLMAITVAVVLWRRRCPYLLIGWFWYLGMLVPVIGLVQVGCAAVADRFTYLPQIGLCIALVWGVADLCRSWAYRHSVCGISGTLVLAILLGCAWRQTSFWCDSETLWTHALACTSQKYAAHNNLGNALANRRRFDEAMAQYQKALEVKPSDAETHNNLGVALAGRGQFHAALSHYRRAVEINPNFAEARNNLGFILARLGRFQEAPICYRQALTTRPNFSEVRGNLGIALAALGQFDEAIAQYQQALEIKPRYAEVHNNLGLALQARGRMDEAMTHFQQALAIKADFVQAHYNLGSAFAAQGRFDEAMAHYRKALDFATHDNNQALADVVRARIAGYEADKPPHQPRPNSVRLPPKP